jgi:hypothetical protein
MKSLRWALWNALFAVLVWLGLVEGVEGARNLTIFLVWVLFVLSLFALQKDVIKEMADKPPSVPRWIDFTYDAAVLALIVWQGSWVLGIAYAIHMLAIAGMWSEVAKLKAGAGAA